MRTRPIRGGFPLLLAVLFAVAACGGAEPQAIDRETFVQTYVDLRKAALQNMDRQLKPTQRDEVLSRHGVSEEDLLGFVDVHGRDVDYMASVWGEVEARLHPQDSTGTPVP
jgi:hypothetical protein